MVAPNEFSFFNFDKSSRQELTGGVAPGERLVYTIDMSHEIKIEKRQVMSLPTFFGEIGGVYAFFVSIVTVLIGGY